MKPQNRKKAMAALKKKGFNEEKRPDFKYTLIVDNKETTITTSIPSHDKDLGIPILTNIKRQLRFQTNAQLRNLLECPLQYEQYVVHLRSINAL